MCSMRLGVALLERTHTPTHTTHPHTQHTHSTNTNTPVCLQLVLFGVEHERAGNGAAAEVVMHTQRGDVDRGHPSLAGAACPPRPS